MNIKYRFAPPDGPVKDFELKLDPETLQSPAPEGTPPEWTRLENKKCEDCPLKEADSPYCPVAVRLAPLAEEFKDVLSFHDATVTVEAQNRTYTKKTSMQVGVSGLFGLVMTTSGCPILDKLRPMVFLHLPFSSGPETLYRSMSMFLMSQFFVAEHGGTPDWTLKGLYDIYDRISRVNVGLLARLRPQVREDATLNAVVNLDCFGAINRMALETKQPAWLERLFKPYWEPR